MDKLEAWVEMDENTFVYGIGVLETLKRMLETQMLNDLYINDLYINVRAKAVEPKRP